MSRKFLVIIIVFVALVTAALGVNAWYDFTYKNVDAKEIPVTPIQVAEQSVLPLSGEFIMPVFGGNQGRYMAILDALRPLLDDRLDDLLEKELSCVPGSDGSWHSVAEGEEPDEPGPVVDLGELGEAPYALSFELPDTMFWSAALIYADDSGPEKPVFLEGEAKQDQPVGLSDKVLILKAGSYFFTAEGTLNNNSPEDPSGFIRYRVQFSIKNPAPLFRAGRTELEQGDILSLRLENLPEGIVPVLESELGPAIFARDVPPKENGTGESAGTGATTGTSDEVFVIDHSFVWEGMNAVGLENWFAAVPISHSRAPGEYSVTILAGDQVYETYVTVKEFEFDFHNMIIDTSIPSVASAVTGDAIAEFREKVIPLFSVFTEERYWDGPFKWPVEMGPEDFISTEFGEIRITNGNQSTRRSHLGVDIAASTGTPVLATGAGRVLLAQFLLNTGYTAVIDHGGGLISIYYHMDSIEDVEGKFVERGQLIGTVGSTGYSTGPHLHFEMRIGEQPVNPSMLLEDSAGLYSAKY